MSTLLRDDFVFGPISPDAVRVRVRLNDLREFEGTIFMPPRSLRAPFNVYVVPVQNLIPGRVIAINREGRLGTYAFSYP